MTKSNKIKVGSIVKRMPDCLHYEFQDCLDMDFEVTKLSLNGEECQIRPYDWNGRTGHCFNETYLTARFILSERDIKNTVGKIDFKSFSHTELIEIEMALEEEWERRSKVKE